MANTTNFGWETPDDTDLVKDGAAAMRTLGNSIDASFVDLKGGTTNQVLAKNSNTDLDFKWVTDATGIQATIFDAKGDLIAASAADTAARLPVGTNGQILSADSAESTGLKWISPATPNFVGCQVYKSTAQLINSGTSTVVSFDVETFDTDAFHSNTTNNTRITIPSGKGGKYLFHFYTAWDNANTGQRSVRWRKNGGSDNIAQNQSNDLDIGISNNGTFILNLIAGDYIEMYVLHSRTGDQLWLGNAYMTCVFLGA
jgi:hypothetical protein